MPLPGSAHVRFAPALALAAVLTTAQGARSQVVIDDSELLQRVDLYPVHLGGSVQRHAVVARRGAAGLARRVLTLGTAGATRAR